MITDTLRQACADYLEFVEGDDYHPDVTSRYENAIFEAAMEMFYGEEIWDRVDAAIERHDERSEREAIKRMEQELAERKRRTDLETRH